MGDFLRLRDRSVGVLIISILILWVDPRRLSSRGAHATAC